MKVKTLILVGTLTFLCFTILQCSGKDEDTVTSPQSPQPTEPDSPDQPVTMSVTQEKVTSSSNAFGLKLFRSLSNVLVDEGNLFISPLSISYALGMALNGANGNTWDEMAAMLEYSGASIEDINNSYRELMDLLLTLDDSVALNIANSIWYRPDLKVEADFINTNQAYFDAEVRSIDFSAPWALDTINSWVSINTNGKINKILNQLNPTMLLCLINAVYFKGFWRFPFDPQGTIRDDFFLSDGTIVKCDMMRSEQNISYLCNDLLQVGGLSFGNGKFYLLILLPHPSVSLSTLINELTPEKYIMLLDSLTPRSIPIKLPKFKYSYEIQLKPVLTALGMVEAFTPRADFTNMVKNGGLSINEIKHKTFVQLDENGVEAAAVTIVNMVGSPGPDPGRLYVDHPFIFMISERTTGAILFIGKVVEPVWEN